MVIVAHAHTDYWTSYFRTSAYGGNPWHNAGGTQVPWTPTMGGDPYSQENYAHL